MYFTFKDVLKINYLSMHLKFPLTYKIAYIKRYIFEKVRCSISRLIQLTIVAYQKTILENLMG